jgi:hypothetical protein
MATLRNQLVGYLAELGTEEGCLALEKLVSDFPTTSWLAHALQRGQEQMRRLSWRPVSPHDLFQLGSNPRCWVLDSESHLLAAIIESLERLQEDLAGENLPAQFLWDRDRPKAEKALSDYVAVHLRRDLKESGVVVNREVEIRPGQLTDVLITAIPQRPSPGGREPLRVVIETKGSWNRKLQSDMKDQLRDRYLSKYGSRYGLYLVLWFPSQRRRKDQHPRPDHRRAINTMKAVLMKQAEEFSNPTALLRVFVLDASLPPRRPKRTVVAKARSPRK